MSDNLLLQSDKSNLRYQLTLDVDGYLFNIEYPLTVEFNIIRTLNGSLGNASFSIYNLSESTRSKLEFNRYSLLTNKAIRKVTFKAGYTNITELATCYIGDIWTAYSERVGADIVTRIEARSGFSAVNQAYSSSLFSAGARKSDILQHLTSDLLRVSHGGLLGMQYISKPQDDVLLRDMAVHGSSFKTLKTLYGDDIFIDLDIIKYLKSTEADNTKNYIQLINSGSGLIGTPKRMDTFLEVEMLFEPFVHLGVAIQIQSTISTKWNGQFKVCGVMHNGTISGAVISECKTKLELLIKDIGNE